MGPEEEGVIDGVGEEEDELVDEDGADVAITS